MKKDFKQLIVWQRAMDMVTEIYKATRTFPKEEMYGLTSQIRRSAVSIPSNIAEGSSRNSQKDFVRFLSIAIGSSFELETQLLIANKINLIDNDVYSEITNKLNQIQATLGSYKSKIIQSTIN